jgi:hypothetical protein
MNRRNKEKPHGATSTTRLRYVHSSVAQLVDLTIFHIPGLDVKVTDIWLFPGSTKHLQATAVTDLVQ